MKDNPPDLQPWIEPELEARIVAWVLGEASEFEAAELERISGEKPELLIFKRRIEAVDGLTRAALRQSPPLRLSPERRAKLLEKLGEVPQPIPEKVKALPQKPKHQKWSWRVRLIEFAAVALILFILGGISLPVFSSVQVRASASKARSLKQMRRLQAEIERSENTAGDQTSSRVDQNLPAPQPLMADDKAPGQAQLPADPAARNALADISKSLSSADGKLASGVQKSASHSITMMTFGGGSAAGGGSGALGGEVRDAADRESGMRPRSDYAVEKGLERPALRFGLNAPPQASSPGSQSQPALLGRSAVPRTAKSIISSAPMAVVAGVSTPIDEARLLSDDDAGLGVNSSGKPQAAANKAQSTEELYANLKQPAESANPQLSPDGGNTDADASMTSGGTLAANGVDGLLFPTKKNKDSFEKPQSAANQPESLSDLSTPLGESEKHGERVQNLSKEAESLYRAGKYDLAQTRYEQVLDVDPYNIAARKGQEKINSAKTNYAMEGSNLTRSSRLYQVEKSWARPVRKFNAEVGNTTMANAGTLSSIDGDRSGSTPTLGDIPVIGMAFKNDSVSLAANPPAEIPSTGLEAGSSIATGGGGNKRRELEEKLERIVIPELNFRNTTVADALKELEKQSEKLDTNEPDPSKKGVKIETYFADAKAPGTAVPTSSISSDARITLNLKNIPLQDALNYVTKLADLKYQLKDGTVTAVPQSEPTDVLVTKEYDVPPSFIAGNGTDPAKAREFLETSGVQFPPGAIANYFRESGKLIVKNTQENVDLIDKVVDIAPKTEPTKQQLVEQVTQSETAVQDQPFSTFSLHVSDVSFRLAQAALAKGEMPDTESIRPEEFYNAFDYADPAPAVGEKVGCRIEQCAHPFLQQRNLVRIAMRVPASGRGKGQPLRLTVLLDTSGSMEREDRSASVRRAMEVLGSLLGPDDRVTLIGFARQPRLLLDQIPGDQAAKLADAVTHTPSEGGTNLEEALKLAGEQALKQHSKAAQNRIVLLTDGAVNLGNAQPESLARMVEKLRQQGVAFDACGVGAEGLNDEILEALTRKGDGRYYFLNRPEDADAGFARQLAGAFRPAAQNVKVQVSFNPARVAHYRLIGFEQHRLKKEDFRNDKVDAAELAAEEAAVALYQVEVLPEGEGELGEVSVRFRDAASTEMVERSWTAPFDAQARAFDQASPAMQLAGTAAILAEKLRGGAMANLIDLDTLAPVVNGLRGRYAPQANVQALVTMFGQMQRMK